MTVFDSDEDYGAAPVKKEEEYIDPNHPRVAVAATKILKSALRNAADDAISIADLWDVFSEFTQKYQYGKFVDALVADFKEDLRRAINLEYREQIILEIKQEIRRKITEESSEKIFAQIEAEIRRDAEEEIRAKLINEMEVQMKEDLRLCLLDELRPEVESRLKVELMGNPAFVEEAKREIQRKVLGL